jgi:hypothetical protein
MIHQIKGGRFAMVFARLVWEKTYGGALVDNLRFDRRFYERS